MPMREVEVSYDGDFRGIFIKCLPQPQLFAEEEAHGMVMVDSRTA